LFTESSHILPKIDTTPV